jgi:hypothetical protein
VTQEIKQDIIYRRMNLPLSAQQVANPQRLLSYLGHIFRPVISYLQYVLKYKQAITTPEDPKNDEDQE